MAHDHHPRPRRDRAARARAGARATGQPALPRPADLPVDPQAGRDRFRGDDRSRPRAPRQPGRALRTVATPEVVRKEPSSDGTTKFLLRLEDGKLIESVFIPDTPATRRFCLSTQVGCAMKCGFCLTGKMGIIRNLTAGEIVGQVRVLVRELGMLDAPLQHRPHGHGRAAAQLRRDDEGAAHPGRRARAGGARRGGSRSRRSACCRRSSGSRPSR